VLHTPIDRPKSTGDEQCLLDLRPARRRQLGDDRPEPVALDQRDGSKLSAQVSGIPSAFESRTSVASPRIVRVARATMISLSVSMTLVRVSRHD
jgi:hypothetical protein